jgi:hypothetical protein
LVLLFFNFNVNLNVKTCSLGCCLRAGLLIRIGAIGFVNVKDCCLTFGAGCYLGALAADIVDLDLFFVGLNLGMIRMIFLMETCRFGICL